MTPLIAYACPRCGHRIPGAHPNAEVAHDCPATPAHHQRWTRYQPQPINEGDAAE